MKRLTEKFGSLVRIKGCKTLYSKEKRKKSPLGSAISRLADYEDIGLSPKDIKRLLDDREDAITALGAIFEGTGDGCEYCKYFPCAEKYRRCIGWEWKGPVKHDN